MERRTEIVFHGDVPAKSDQPFLTRIYRNFKAEKVFPQMEHIKDFELVDAYIIHHDGGRDPEGKREECLPCPGEAFAFEVFAGHVGPLVWPAVKDGDDMVLVIRNKSDQPRHFRCSLISGPSSASLQDR